MFSRPQFDPPTLSRFLILLESCYRREEERDCSPSASHWDNILESPSLPSPCQSSPATRRRPTVIIRPRFAGSELRRGTEKGVPYLTHCLLELQSIPPPEKGPATCAATASISRCYSLRTLDLQKGGGERRNRDPIISSA